MLGPTLDPQITRPLPAIQPPLIGDGHRPAELAVGTVTADVLYRLWSGRDRIVVVDSPPGAGKSTLVATVIAHLEQRSDLTITVATSTRRQMIDIAGRVAQQLGPDRVWIDNRNIDPADLPEGVSSRRPGTKKNPRSHVTVRTVASCRFRPPEVDLLVVDEAYQATYADVALAADAAEQVLLVGDPGQIGPVVTIDTTVWERRRLAPHRRAPEVFARRPDTTVLNLDVTWRLGRDTVTAIAPLYRFPFHSGRPDRSLAGLPEIATIDVEPSNDPAHLDALRTIVDRVQSMIGRTLTERGSDRPMSRPLSADEIAVVCSHNAQVSTVSAMLRARDLGDVHAGTADRMQGGQWHAVIALDPLVGHETASAHSLSLGRLCVMASRHLTHLTWVHDGQAERLLAADATRAARKGLAVRRRLMNARTTTTDRPLDTTR